MRWVTILREADQRPVPEVAKKHGISGQTIYACCALWCPYVDGAIGNWRQMTRPHASRAARPRRRPLLQSAVELRLGEKRRRLPQDVVGAFQRRILSLQRFELLALVSRQARPPALVTLGLAHPPPQGLVRAANLLGDRPPGEPARFNGRIRERAYAASENHCKGSASPGRVAPFTVVSGVALAAAAG